MNCATCQGHSARYRDFDGTIEQLFLAVSRDVVRVVICLLMSATDFDNDMMYELPYEIN
jgi:hypothetical protein